MQNVKKKKIIALCFVHSQTKRVYSNALHFSAFRLFLALQAVLPSIMDIRSIRVPACVYTTDTFCAHCVRKLTKETDNQILNMYLKINYFKFSIIRTFPKHTLCLELYSVQLIHF